MEKMKDQNQEHFDGAARSWDEKPERVALAKAIAAAIVAKVAPKDTMTAMEFGCGTGLISMNLAPHVKSIMAVDSSSQMIAVLKDKLRKQGPTTITPHYLDPQEDRWPPDATFDLIFSGMVLHHIEDVDKLLMQFHGALDAGGTIALADLDAEDGGFHGDLDGVFHHGFHRQGLIEKLEKAGFAEMAASTAHTVIKKNDQGREERFPVFLITAKKA
jgi:ubiquinone/menaquinone biosynthesis C-methylase UbiE